MVLTATSHQCAIASIYGSSPVRFVSSRLRVQSIFAFWFVLLCLVSLLQAAAAAATTADSVVSVIGWNSLAMWSGSGFVVGDGRWVVTCFHVAARKLANDRPLVPARLTVVSPWTGDAEEARVVRTDSEADLAL